VGRPTRALERLRSRFPSIQVLRKKGLRLSLRNDGRSLNVETPFRSVPIIGISQKNFVGGNLHRDVIHLRTVSSLRAAEVKPRQPINGICRRLVGKKLILRRDRKDVVL
jgi:hypothetical protein